MFQAKEYVKPASLEEAYRLCQKRSSVVVGGMMWLKMETIRKQTIVDLSDLGLGEIRESEEEFQIGAMVTLRMLETDEGLNREFDGIFKECTRHIVGVQFRNGATVGGSVYGRFGFSDILTALLALDTEVELYHGGRMPLAEFAARPRQVTERDILTYVYVKKDKRKAAYLSERRTSTDFPLIACCGARTDWGWQFAVGARPGKAETVSFRVIDGWLERQSGKSCQAVEECQTGEGCLAAGECQTGEMCQTAEACQKAETQGTGWIKAAELPQDQAEGEAFAEILAGAAAASFTYGTNLTGSGTYRAYLAKVLLKRLILSLLAGNGLVESGLAEGKEEER